MTAYEFARYLLEHDGRCPTKGSCVKECPRVKKLLLGWGTLSFIELGAIPVLRGCFTHNVLKDAEWFLDWVKNKATTEELLEI
jgi:hypothetical protein